ncbi:MAG: hypothetical protein VXA34_00955 [Gammaproteobacteria bacterium]
MPIYDMHSGAMDPAIWNSHQRTLHLAQIRRHKARYIDDDCLLITFHGDRDDWVQVTFDNFTPTNKLSRAVDSQGNEYRSYQAVRKLIERKGWAGW